MLHFSPRCTAASPFIFFGFLFPCVVIYFSRCFLLCHLRLSPHLSLVMCNMHSFSSSFRGLSLSHKEALTSHVSNVTVHPWYFATYLMEMVVPFCPCQFYILPWSPAKSITLSEHSVFRTLHSIWTYIGLFLFILQCILVLAVELSVGRDIFALFCFSILLFRWPRRKGLFIVSGFYAIRVFVSWHKIVLTVRWFSVLLNTIYVARWFCSRRVADLERKFIVTDQTSYSLVGAWIKSSVPILFFPSTE